MAEKINILMTGAGAPGAPGILRCLQQDNRFEIHLADADPMATGRFLHGNFYQVPKGTDAHFPEALLQVAMKCKAAVVLPLVTRELLPLAESKSLFEASGIRVLVSPASAIQVANDKAACYQFLTENSIAVPDFRVAGTTEEFIHAAFELGHPKQPFTFKPSRSNGSRGFRIVSDSIDESEQLFGQKPYNTFITYPHALKILSSKAFPELVVSEYLPGDEYSIDCLANHGRMLTAVPRLRTKMINGISVQGKFVRDEEITGYCSRIIEALALHGNIGIQVKRSAVGRPLLLEINPRVQGTIVAGLGAGINLPLLAVKKELGLPVEDSELDVKWGTCFSRYWTEVFYQGC